MPIISVQPAQRSDKNPFKKANEEMLSAEKKYMKAEKLLTEKHPSDALQLIKEAAEFNERNPGYSMAQCRLGEMYAEGKILSQDYEVALTYFQQAAENACPRACMNLGVMYIMGHGVTRDIKAGLHHLVNAERLYQLHAKRELDKSHDNVEKYQELSVIVEGKKTFGMDQGITIQPAKVLPTALYLLSKIYEFKASLLPAKNVASEDNETYTKKTKRYLEEAADKNHALASFSLKLAEGEDDKYLLELLKKAANDGCPFSSYELGCRLYAKNFPKLRNTPIQSGKELDSAISYLKQAADAGHAKAVLHLGTLYASHDLPVYNSNLAEKYLKKAFADPQTKLAAANQLSGLYSWLCATEAIWAFILNYRAKELQYGEIAKQGKYVDTKTSRNAVALEA